MKKLSSTTCFAALLVGLIPPPASGQTVDFEDLTTFTGDSLEGGGQFYNGNDGSGTTNSDGWTSGGVTFGNSYNGDSLPAFDFWSGWSYSNVVNTTSPGFTNQYASFPGGGSDGSGGVDVGGIYAVASGGAYFNLPANTLLSSVDLTNNTYAALSMRDGDSFAKKFGGETGDDPDFFRVTLNGFDGMDGTGTSVGSVTVDLADFTFDDNAQDYTLDRWLTVDLSSIAAARSVSLAFESSDTGTFGINTPTYVALDNLAYSRYLLGDFNGDEIVAFEDFLLFSEAFGESVPPADAKFDLDGSGLVDFADFLKFSAAFGQTLAEAQPSSSLAAVPEPNSFGFSVVSLAGWALLRRRRNTA